MIVALLRTVAVSVLRGRLGFALVVAFLVAIQIPSALAGERGHGLHAGHLTSGSSVVATPGLDDPPTSSPQSSLPETATCHAQVDCLRLLLPSQAHPQKAGAVNSRSATELHCPIVHEMAGSTGAVPRAPSLAELGVSRI